jgi:peptidoglycan hydrolase-like protein with peptidoglycan-binding domain
MKNKTILNTLILTLALSPVFSSAAMLTRQLQLGMSGADISTLQAYLAQDRTIYPQGLVTGYFGFLTKSAVANFQSHNGISPVGRVGPQTLAFINSIWLNGNNNNNNTNNYQAVIGQLSLSTSNNQVNISWNTSVETTAAVYYSTSPLTLTEATDSSPFMISGGSAVVVNSDLRTSHSGSITGLSPNTTYHYVVYVKDTQGNESITLPTTFRTSN